MASNAGASIPDDFDDYEDPPPERGSAVRIAGIGVGVAVIGTLVGLAIAWPLGEEPPEHMAKVTRQTSVTEVELPAVVPEPREPEPKPEPDPPAPEPELVEPDPQPQPTKRAKKRRKKAGFYSAWKRMIQRIQTSCAGKGSDEIYIDTLVKREGGTALYPKINPPGPTATCAMKILKATTFPADEKEHRVTRAKVRWTS